MYKVSEVKVSLGHSVVYLSVWAASFPPARPISRRLHLSAGIIITEIIMFFLHRHKSQLEVI